MNRRNLEADNLVVTDESPRAQPKAGIGKEMELDAFGHKGSAEHALEVLKEGEECPFCHFARLERDGDEVICPVCGYGRTSCT